MMKVDHRLEPGRLTIIVEGVESIAEIKDLDVLTDSVRFLVRGERVVVEIGHPAIDVQTCAARFKKKQLVLSWSSDRGAISVGKPIEQTGAVEGEFVSGRSTAHPDIADASAPEPEDITAPQRMRHPMLQLGKSVAHFPLGWCVDWALDQLIKMQVQDSARGFDRFKAEVGLAELAFYACRCCRLGTPAALHAQVQASEGALQAWLAARAAGEEPAAAMREVIATLQRVGGAVADANLEVPPVAPLGDLARTSWSGIGQSLATARWRLRDGAGLVGPGVGTWKLGHKEVEARVLEALRIGAQHVDTASEYATEGAVANALKLSRIPREEVFVNLKVTADSPHEMRSVLAASFGRWGLGPVDCLMLHRVPRDPGMLEAVWEVLEEQVKNGRARSLGASNVTASNLKVLTSPRRLCPAVVQLKCSVFHQGAYFTDEDPALLWALIRKCNIVPIGISLFNPLHSCVAPLQEPLITTWAATLGCSPAVLIAHWARQVGVCPLLKCSLAHAQELFRSELVVPPAILSALSCLSSLTETAFCPALRDAFDLRVPVCRLIVRSGERLRGRCVEVHSLKSVDAEELNGCRGKLGSFDDESGRWQVFIVDKCKSILPEHLVLLKDGVGQLTTPKHNAAVAAAQLLQELLAAGSVDGMLQLLSTRRDDVTWALAETVSANLTNAVAKGYVVKQQVLAKLLSALKSVFESRRPDPECVKLPPPALDASSIRSGTSHESYRLISAVSAMLNTDGFVVCDNFASVEEVSQLAAELGVYDAAFETAKIWVGRQAAGAQLYVPSVRSDRVFWVCGEHKTPHKDMMWDSAGSQPTTGLAPCRPEIVMSQPAHGFHKLTAFMRRIDEFVLRGLAPRCPRLKGLVERSDAMVSIYADGARFQKHVDNPSRDGRVLTSIVYLNDGQHWKAEDGGELRIFPLDSREQPVELSPEGGRLVLFWADQLPHEVLPSRRRRMALTYWWFDRSEREAKVRELAETTRANAAALPSADESLAQEFIQYLLTAQSKPEDIMTRARALPERALLAVADVVGARDCAEAMEGLERLSAADLDRLRGSLGKMGLD